MRKVTQKTCNAFENRRKCTSGNTYTDGNALYLHGNKIAEWIDGELYISSCGWETVTTKERLNGLHGVNIYQKDFVWYLNGVAWHDSAKMTKVIDHKEPTKPQTVIDGETFTVSDDNPKSYCVGCGHALPEYPALSRYNHGDICSDCGVREALQGDFIASK